MWMKVWPSIHRHGLEVCLNGVASAASVRWVKRRNARRTGPRMGEMLSSVGSWFLSRSGGVFWRYIVPKGFQNRVEKFKFQEQPGKWSQLHEECLNFILRCCEMFRIPNPVKINTEKEKKTWVTTDLFEGFVSWMCCFWWCVSVLAWPFLERCLELGTFSQTKTPTKTTTGSQQRGWRTSEANSTPSSSTFYLSSGNKSLVILASLC